MMNGLDWRTIGWPEYQTLLAHWNVRHTEGGDRPEPDLSRLRRAMDAHQRETVH